MKVDIPKSETDRAIENFRKMGEVESHKKVYQPLLSSMGYQHIQYCHGSSERGKDFICLDPGRLGNMSLTVVQIKNERITGKSKSRNSAVGVIHQLLQCLSTRVLNPLTHREEIPRKAILFTSYPIPDSTVSGMGEHIDVLLRQCEIVGPSQLMTLIKAHLPDYYGDLLYPGEGISAAMLRNITT